MKSIIVMFFIITIGCSSITKPQIQQISNWIPIACNVLDSILDTIELIKSTSKTKTFDSHVEENTCDICEINSNAIIEVDLICLQLAINKKSRSDALKCIR